MTPLFLFLNRSLLPLTLLLLLAGPIQSAIPQGVFPETLDLNHHVGNPQISNTHFTTCHSSNTRISEINQTTSSGQPEIIAAWNFAGDSRAANQGISANLGQLVLRESTFTGTYSYINSTTGNRALSTVSWADGQNNKFWMIQISTLGYGDLKMTSVQRSTNTGPRDFQLQYRIGTSGNWISVEGAAIVVADNYTTGALQSITLPESAYNKPQVFIRWLVSSNTAVGGAAIGTGSSALDRIEITGTYSEDFKRIVTGVESVSALEVNEGTPFGDLGLPENLLVSFEDEGSMLLPVTWEPGNYNPQIPGSYTLWGTLLLNDNMENPNNIKAQVQVKVIAVVVYYQVDFRLDMAGAAGFNPATDKIYITGSMMDWALPGTLPEQQILQALGNNLYGISMELLPADYYYRYYINAGLSNPEPGNARYLKVTNSFTKQDVWLATQSEQLKQPALRLAPNPASDFIQITHQEVLQEIRIYNLQGQLLIKHQPRQFSYRLDVRQLETGLYLLHLITPTGQHSQKILIRR